MIGFMILSLIIVYTQLCIKMSHMTYIIIHNTSALLAFDFRFPV